MLNAKQRQTHYLFDITVLISKIKRRLTRVPAVKGRLPSRPRKHSRFSALRQRATRAGGPGAEGAVIGNVASVPRARVDRSPPPFPACSRFVRNTVIEISYKDLLIVAS